MRPLRRPHASLRGGGGGGATPRPPPHSPVGVRRRWQREGAAAEGRGAHTRHDRSRSRPCPPPPSPRLCKLLYFFFAVPRSPARARATLTWRPPSHAFPLAVAPPVEGGGDSSGSGGDGGGGGRSGVPPVAAPPPVTVAASMVAWQRGSEVWTGTLPLGGRGEGEKGGGGTNGWPGHGRGAAKGCGQKWGGDGASGAATTPSPIILLPS